MSDHRPRHFATTHWSLVLAAGGDPSTAATEALSALCAAYWYPLYAFLRRRGHAPEDAEDLTQGFFRQLLERGAVRVADPSRGRFRSFLLTALQHYVINEHGKTDALKRGGGQRPQSLDVESAEGRYANEPRTDDTPEHAFDRRWALTLLDRALARCAAEYAASGRRALFDQLAPVLTAGDAGRPYDEIARDCAMTEGAVKVAAHRLRERYRRVLRDEVAQTVSSAEEIDVELRHLAAALAPQRPAH